MSKFIYMSIFANCAFLEDKTSSSLAQTKFRSYSAKRTNHVLAWRGSQKGKILQHWDSSIPSWLPRGKRAKSWVGTTRLGRLTGMPPSSLALSREHLERQLPEGWSLPLCTLEGSGRRVHHPYRLARLSEPASERDLERLAGDLLGIQEQDRAGRGWGKQAGEGWGGQGES